MNFIWLSIYLSVGLYVPNGIFTNVVLIYRAPSVVDCSFEDMFPVLFYIQQMLRGDKQTKKHLSVGLYVPNGIFTNVVLIYRAPSDVDCSFEDMFPVLFHIQQMLRGDKQTKKHVYQSLINNNFTYHITTFFHGKLFSCFAICDLICKNPA